MPPYRVLVIEDNADIAAMFQRMAELAGHEARACRTGFEALELAPKFQPHVVLLDLGLPDMDGWQIARALRNNCLLSKVRIVVVSVFQTAADKLKSKLAGIDLHLGKPVHQIDIVRAIMGEISAARPHHHGHESIPA